MKTKAIYLAAFFLMTVVATFGSDEPKKAGVAVIPVKGAEVFKVIYKSETPGRVKVFLYGANSEIVYSGAFNNTDGFILPLNFSRLSFGEYRLELIDGNGRSTEKIVYAPARSIVGNIRIARLASEQSKFLVTVSNAKNDKVTVRIFDSYNNLLHNEVKSVNGDFAQVYNVKNLTGACTFEVSDHVGTVKTVQF